MGNLRLTITLVLLVGMAARAFAATVIDTRQEVAASASQAFSEVLAQDLDSTGDDGGVIWNEGVVTIRGESNFTHNTSDQGGAIYNVGELNIFQTNFTGNFVESSGLPANGGAIYSDNEGSVVIADAVFEDNAAQGEGGAVAAGGAIHNGRGTMRISQTDFINNTAFGAAFSSGGAVYLDDVVDGEGNPLSIVDIDGSSFRNNQASWGGAIDNIGSLSLTNVTFLNNVATFEDLELGGAGGALHNESLLSATRTLFQENTAFHGGAIYNQGWAIVDGAFTRNHAGNGGAIYNEQKLMMDGASFTDNDATYDRDVEYGGKGGAIFNTNVTSDLLIFSTQFSNNRAVTDIFSAEGGAIYCEEGDVTLDKIVFANNQAQGLDGASGNGGAIYYGRGTALVSNATFTNNSAVGSAISGGGAVYISGAIDGEGNPLALAAINDATFKGNQSSWGGAIDNLGSLELQNVTFQENIATFTDPDFGGVGGAIRNYNLAFMTGGLFQENRAFDGGALYNQDTAEVSSTFLQNHALLGGAIYNARHLVVNGSRFVGNDAVYDVDADDGGFGGAIFNLGSYSTLDISQTDFANNRVATDTLFAGGGALYSDGGTINLEDVSFTGNIAQGINEAYGKGGAIYHGLGTMTIGHATFTSNTAEGALASSGGAIYVNGVSDGEGNPQAIVNVNDSSFQGNQANIGGAIDNIGSMAIDNSTFRENVADYPNPTMGGGMGGALRNFRQAEITDSSFTNNVAVRAGGAVYNEGDLSFFGENVFAGNRAAGALNDIYNEGTINVAGHLTIDGGITGTNHQGHLIFANHSVLQVRAGITSIGQNRIINQGAELAVKVKNGFVGVYNLLSAGSTLDHDFTVAGDNVLYDITASGSRGTYLIRKKPNEEVAAALGLSEAQFAPLAAITKGAGGNAIFDKVADQISDLIQAGDMVSVRNAQTVADSFLQTDIAQIQQIQAMAATQALRVGEARLAKGLAESIFSTSANDASKTPLVWGQGLLGHGKFAQGPAFKFDMHGAALGVEKRTSKVFWVGAGYVYGKTDGVAQGRAIDGKSHSLLGHGEYRADDGFINGIISYGKAEYQASKMVLEDVLQTRYDTRTLAMEANMGRSFFHESLALTPAVGLRYVHLETEGRDTADQFVTLGDRNILTLLAGAKLSKTAQIAANSYLMPSVQLVVAADLNKQKPRKEDLFLPNGAEYQNTRTNAFDRVGLEIGGNLAVKINERMGVLLSYMGKFKKDYQNHHGLLDVHYHF